MENKKPLIIVPPMSEPMIKLKEILEGIAAEENIEIFTVEDAKEFTQLLGSGGQSLVMMSNAKLCATLLQENKTIISKHHTKVILLTPKEIPIKTLEKFRKVGLTESILESTAPKTLLYKVKLQLKSIKITIKEDATQQVIKTMLDSGPKMKLAEDEMSITESKNADEISTSSDEVLKKIQKSEEENTLDYLGNLKGKKSKSEEQIETHWKSKREKTSQDENSEEEDIYGKSKIETEEDIDMYYRGKLKKGNLELVEEQEDLYKKKNSINEEESADYDLDRKNQEEEILPETKRKKNLVNEEEINDFYEKKEKHEDEEQAPTEKRKKALIEEEIVDDYIEKKNKIDDEEESEKESDLVKVEDLGGHYKGKLNTELQEEVEEDYKDKNENIEEVLLERKKKEKLFNEEEEQVEKESKSKILEEENQEPNEGQVDHIDSFMRGNAETTAAIKTRMESEFTEKDKTVDETISSDIKKKKQEDQALDEEESSKNRLKLAEESNNDFYQKTELEQDSGNENSSEKEKLIDLEAEDAYERKNSQLDQDNDKDFNNKKDSTEKVESEFNQRSLEKRKEEEKETKKSNSTNLEIEKATESNNHSGKADKISTYYKSGENNKKEQDWDIPQEKKSTTLDIVKAKQKDNYISNNKKANDDEVVIDYRKLKEEFEQISRDGFANGDSIGASSSPKDKRNYSSEEEYKVIEIGPHAFDFSIDILNLIYQNDIKATQLIKTIGEKLFNEEKAILITQQYKLSDKKYTETYNAFIDLNANLNDEMKIICDEYTKKRFNLDKFHTYSMPLWMCQTIPENDDYWKDYDLPSWAKNELVDKPVELIYPFFDGVDRMGFAYLLFPNGINPTNEKKITIIIEMLRSVFLDSIQRTKKNESPTTNESDENVNNEPASNKIIGFFGNFFGKKKAG